MKSYFSRVGLIIQFYVEKLTKNNKNLINSSILNKHFNYINLIKIIFYRNDLLDTFQLSSLR